MMPKAERGVGGGQGWEEVLSILGTEACSSPRPCWTHSQPDQGEGGGPEQNLQDSYHSSPRERTGQPSRAYLTCLLVLRYIEYYLRILIK